MSFYKLTAPCLLGSEGLVADELKYMGLEGVSAQNGRVVFDGTEEAMARANINSRYASRILILLGEFTATTFDELFDQTKNIPWEEFIGKDYKFPIKGKSVSSKLASTPDCQSIIKKAIVERLKTAYRLDWFKEEGALTQVQFLIMKDKVSLMIDTSGPSLHKRGYRRNSNLAPIKENLGAMMIKLARVRSNATFYDPFCGSGTLLIEAAMYAHRIAPGMRRNFAAQEFTNGKIWTLEKERAKAAINKDAEFIAFGSDIDPAAVELTMNNAKKAGVASKIHVEQADICDFKANSQYGCVVTNPPYGERLLDLRDARKLYKTMGEVFVQKSGWNYTIISPDEEFEKIFGRSSDKRRKLYNGMLKCQVFMYYK